jgi:hypothetical protein
MIMKTFIKYNLLFLTGLLLSGIMLTSCDDDKKDKPSGPPSVSYIRLTDPAKADSFLTRANMGQLIAIVGENLGHLRQLYFNDQEASLTPTYITNKSVIANVPNSLPSVIDNKMRMIFSDGATLEYDFVVDVAPPEIYGIKCEYVPDGDIVVLYGDYLFEPTVIFPDDLEGEVVTKTKTQIEVVVPKGAVSGNITVRNTIGEAVSDFYFRDNRNVIVDFDTKLHETWTAAIIYIDSVPDAYPCDGNYAEIQSDEVAAWDWENNLAMMYWAQADVAVADGIPSQLKFCFEVNVPEEWYDVPMEIYFAPFGGQHGRDLQDDGGNYITSFYRWRPYGEEPYTTDGWITLSIPLSDFAYGHDDGNIPPDQGTNPLTDISNLTNITMMVF